MRRRAFIAGLGAAALAPLAPVEAQGKRPLIAVLSLNASAQDRGVVAAFIDALGQFGYVDGKNVSIAARYAGGNPQMLPQLAAELAALKPSVVMADTASPIKAVLRVAPGLPIVGATMGYPVEQGLVASFAHPGGNVTGIASSVEDMNAKLLELALEAIPSATRLGLLVNPAGDNAAIYRRDLEAAAQKRGIGFRAAEARDPGEIDDAVQALADYGADIMIVQPNGLMNTERKRIADAALAQHLPTISTGTPNVEAGQLMSYGIDYVASYRRAAYFVDKILKGAKPAELPVEFPTKLEIGVNLKTAKALGITLPQSILVRADEVIE